MPPVSGNALMIFAGGIRGAQLMHNQRDIIREGTGGSVGAVIAPLVKLDKPISLRLCINQ